MKTYSWGIFFENGDKATMDFPFGPVHPDNLITSLEDPWVEKVLEYLPKFISTMKEMELPFAFIVVNPPVESSEAHIKFWSERGFE